MRQKHTLWRTTPLLLCSAAFLTLPGASLAQTMQDQQKQPPAQSQQQAPAATQSQTPSATQPQGQAPSTAQQPSQKRNAQTPQGTGRQQTQSPAPSGTQTTQQPQQTQTPRSTQQPSTAQQPSTTQQPSTAQQPSTRQQPSTAQQPSAPGQAGTTTATLTDQQRTKISSSISQANVQPVRNVNFSVNVGTVVPSSVRFYPVTRAMIDVYPQFRGHHFMVVNEEIVIVEPRTRRIVQVVPYQGGGQATLRSKLKLSDKQRNVIRSSVRRSSAPATTGSTTTVEEISIGDTLPESVVIERFPDTVYREVPSIRSYQYITRDRGVYLVDPRERRVIELID